MSLKIKNSTCNKMEVVNNIKMMQSYLLEGYFYLRIFYARITILLKQEITLMISSLKESFTIAKAVARFLIWTTKYQVLYFAYIPLTHGVYWKDFKVAMHIKRLYHSLIFFLSPKKQLYVFQSQKWKLEKMATQNYSVYFSSSVVTLMIWLQFLAYIKQLTA